MMKNDRRMKGLVKKLSAMRSNRTERRLLKRIAGIEAEMAIAVRQVASGQVEGTAKR